MKKAEEAFENDDSVQFLYLQTVFEGKHANTFKNGVSDIKKYGLKGPFGQDAYDKNGRPITMGRYKTRGTPWFVIVNPEGIVEFNDFRFSRESVEEASKKLIAKLKELSTGAQDKENSND